MMKRVGLVALMIFVGRAAQAANSGADSQGEAAFALAALVAENDTSLPQADREVIAALFEGSDPPAFPKERSISVRADKISCRVSDVAINQRSCALTFGLHTVNLTGRRANELDATLAADGVSKAGVAGSIYEALTALDCSVNPSDILRKSGGGANCAFTPEH